MRDDTAMQVSGGSFPPCVAPPVLLPAVGMDRDARCRGRAISHRRMDGLGDDTRTRLTALYNSSTSINPCITCPDDPCIIKDKKQMIKCNVTVCGVIGRDASVRKNKEEKEFLGTDSGDGWRAHYRGGCPQGGLSGGSRRLSERLPCRSEGYDVSQTPGRQAIFQPVRR